MKPEFPPFQSINELVQFFDTHDMGDYWDGMPEANFDVSITGGRRFVEIEEDLLNKLHEIARSKHVSAEALIDAWLREKAG